MNLVVDDAVEVYAATKDAPEKRRELGMHFLALISSRWKDQFANGCRVGQILLKGDNVTLIQSMTV